MPILLFNHLNINGSQVWSPEVNLVLAEDASVVAYYDSPDLDALQAEAGYYRVYLSGVLGDYYVFNTASSTIPARFPTLDECLAWVEENTPQASGGLLPLLALGWVLTR